MESEIKTIKTSAATIKFSGGLDSNESSSDSESGDEVAKSDKESNGEENNVEAKETNDSVNTNDSITIIDPSCEENSSPSYQPSEKIKNLMEAERFNPFDKDEYDENEILFPQADQTCGVGKLSVTNLESSAKSSELGIFEDHFCSEGNIRTFSVEELENEISTCKELILASAEHSDERRALVAKLVQFRLQLAEIKENSSEGDLKIKQVVGHHFEEKANRRTKKYCEKCNYVIWGVLSTTWYRCRDCGFSCHAKCLNLITRTCASVQVSENPTYILNICPEKGLPFQNFKCVECKSAISYEPGVGIEEPRLCDYTGNYYCPKCHWNDLMVIPARVVHNWDITPQKVCRATKQLLKLMIRKPALNLVEINPLLFNYVEELTDIKKYREEILVMKKYFLTCKDALESKLLLQIFIIAYKPLSSSPSAFLKLTHRQHFVETSDVYSLQDLIDVQNDILLPEVAKIHASFAQHIKTDCERCQGQGYICELCDYDEVLFPFDNHALVCQFCSTVLHRHCFMRKGEKCPKCERTKKHSPS